MDGPFSATTTRKEAKSCDALDRFDWNGGARARGSGEAVQQLQRERLRDVVEA